MLRAGELAGALNLKPTQRLSVLIAYLTLVSTLVAVFWPEALICAAAGLLAVTALNHDFYRFFFNRRGIWFTLRVVPMHWLYFLYCGLSAAVGALLHFLEKGRYGFPPSRINRGAEK
jgi:hypothetical protein